MEKGSGLKRVETLVYDARTDGLRSELGTDWRVVSDRVMGGCSLAELRCEDHAGRRCLCLYGDVRLENGGGFIQTSLDLGRFGGVFDARDFSGLRLAVFGNGERYSVHLRTEELERPWQSYRAHFVAPAAWTEVQLHFGDFEPHRVEAPFDLARLRRIGLVGIGRAFHVELRFSRLEFFA